MSVLIRVFSNEQLSILSTRRMGSSRKPISFLRSLRCVSKISDGVRHTVDDGQHGPTSDRKEKDCIFLEHDPSYHFFRSMTSNLSLECAVTRSFNSFITSGSFIAFLKVSTDLDTRSRIVFTYDRAFVRSSSSCIDDTSLSTSTSLSIVP